MSAIAKFVVCPACEGEGFVGTLGAYSMIDFYEAFEDADEYNALHEVSKVACEACNGQRVLTTEAAATWEAEADERAEYEAERAAEMRYGC